MDAAGARSQPRPKRYPFFVSCFFHIFFSMRHTFLIKMIMYVMYYNLGPYTSYTMWHGGMKKQSGLWVTSLSILLLIQGSRTLRARPGQAGEYLTTGDSPNLFQLKQFCWGKREQISPLKLYK